MTVRKRGKKWEVRWHDGSGKKRSQSFPRKLDAQEFYREVMTDLRRGDYVAPSSGKIQVKAWTEEWLEGAHHLAPRTREIYQEALSRILPELGHYELRRLTGQDIDAALASRLSSGAAPATVHQEWRALRTSLKAAVRAKKIPRTPTDDATPPRVPDSDIRFLTVVELEALIDAFDPRYRTWAEVAGYGGLRWGELAGLQVQSVDEDGSRVQVVRQITAHGETREPKWNSKRWVSLPPSVAKRLGKEIRGRAPADLVWTAPKGGPLSHRGFTGWLPRWEVFRDGKWAGWSPHDPSREDRGREAADRLAAKLGGTVRWKGARGQFLPAAAKAGLGSLVEVEVDDDEDGASGDGRPSWDGPSPHDLRHTAVALAIAAGAHPKAIQRRMGHRSIQTTLDRYGHLFPEIDGELAAALDEMRPSAA